MFTIQHGDDTYETQHRPFESDGVLRFVYEGRIMRLPADEAVLVVPDTTPKDEPPEEEGEE